MVTLDVNDALSFKIDGTVCLKDTVRFTPLADGERYDIIVAGQQLYQKVLYSNIAYMEDDEPVAFTSVAAFEEWIDNNCYKLFPYARPFKYISEATTNCQLVKGAAGLLLSVTASNTGETLRYLKVYDLVTEPTDADIPILTFPLPVDSAFTTNLLPETLKMYKGIGISITGAAGDTDETEIGAAEVLVNLIYR